MAWRPHGHARVDPSAPQAFAKCDRCQFLFNLVDLRYQREWAGAKQIKKRLRVCARCLDKPQQQLRDKRIRADGRPVKDPRPLNNPAPAVYVEGPFDDGFSNGFDNGSVPIDPQDFVP